MKISLENKKVLTFKTKIVSGLKYGDRVIIYCDPITKLKPEGSAVLKRRIGEADPELQRWKVQFEGDGETGTYERSIAAPFEVIEASAKVKSRSVSLTVETH